MASLNADQHKMEARRRTQSTFPVTVVHPPQSRDLVGALRSPSYSIMVPTPFANFCDLLWALFKTESLLPLLVSHSSWAARFSARNLGNHVI